MKKTTKLWMALPIAAVALALGGCGGDGGDDDNTPGVSGSIVDCFTINSTVSFALTSTNAGFPNRSTAGPMTYNGQAVTGQIFSYPSGYTVSTQSNYWTVASSGVTMIAAVINNSTVMPDGTFLPQNMSPGQTATDSSNNITTFVGFETITLAGKTFTNTCHTKEVTPDGIPAEGWYAPKYGLIKQTASNGTWQYNGDL